MYYLIGADVHKEYRVAMIVIKSRQFNDDYHSRNIIETHNKPTYLYYTILIVQYEAQYKYLHTYEGFLQDIGAQKGDFVFE